jgi:TolB protein
VTKSAVIDYFADRRWLVVGVCLTLFVACAAPALAAKHDVVVASRATGIAGEFGEHDSWTYGGSLSADGRIVGFTSRSANLAPDDAKQFPDVFVRDAASAVTSLVSRSSTGEAGNLLSWTPSVSADGRYVAFWSESTNLTKDGRAGAFVRDLQTGTSEFVSRASGPAGEPVLGGTAHGSISADGRYVAFTSRADQLRGLPPGQGWSHIFVRDRLTSETILVSRADGIDGAAAEIDSDSPSISSDGRFVAFRSGAANLSDADEAGSDVFIRDLSQNRTLLVSRESGEDGPGADFDSGSPSISADGRYVAFQSDATNLSEDDYDVVYDETLDQNVAVTDVFVRDMQARETTLVSRMDGPFGDGADYSSLHPSITADGRFVAFDSKAPNLSDEDVDIYPVNPEFQFFALASDVFVRDLVGGTTIYVSRAGGASGAPGDRDSEYPAFAPGSGYVAFQSRARNLTPERASPVWNVYRRQLVESPAQPANASAARDSVSPVISRVGMTRRRFAVGRNPTPISARRTPRGTAFRYSLSERASVKIVIERAHRGVRVKLRCKPRPRKITRRRACTRFKAVGSLRRRPAIGAVRAPFSGRIGRRALRPGRYRAVLRATDAAGNDSKAARVAFKVVGR